MSVDLNENGGGDGMRDSSNKIMIKVGRQRKIEIEQKQPLDK